MLIKKYSSRLARAVNTIPGGSARAVEKMFVLKETTKNYLVDLARHIWKYWYHT